MPNKMNVPEGWEIVKLGQCISVLKSGLSRKLSDYDIGIPVLRSNNIGNKTVDFNDIKYWYINDPQGSTTSNYFLEEGDILINFINSLAQIGKACLFIDKIDRPCIYTTNILRLKVNNKIIPYYFYLFTKTSVYRNFIFAKTNPAVNQASFTTKDFKKLKILLPPLPEQQKISEILSTWDKAIDTTEKLIQNKKQLKKYLMQKLLSGKIHFKEFNNKKWAKISLKNFLKLQMRPIDKPNKQYKSLGIRSHGKGIFIKTVDNPESVMMDTLYQVKENDLILNITFAWEGAIAIVAKQHEVGLVSHRFPTFVFDKEFMIPEYFKQIIIGERFKYKLGLVSPGGAGRNRVLDKKAFLELKVNIPSDINEQKKIANLLNSLDEEIQVLEKYRYSLNNQKQGLMQKLLTGKIRVKV